MMTKKKAKKKQYTPFFLTQSRPPKKKKPMNRPALPLTTHYIKKTQRTCQASNTPCARLHRSVPALQGKPFVSRGFFTRFQPRLAPWTDQPPPSILGLVSTRRHVLRKLHVENLLLEALKKKGKPIDSWGASWRFWGGGKTLLYNRCTFFFLRANFWKGKVRDL